MIAHRCLAIAATLCLGCLCSNSLDAQEKPGPAATIDDVAWIAGHWQGQAMGGQFEETWNPPLGGSMMGVFKFVQNESIGFYEILTIVPQGESLVLRLKHFHADLKGWEEQDKSVEFPLLEVAPNEARFDGLTFKKTGDNQMLITVVVDQGEGGKEIDFACERVRPLTDQDFAVRTVLKLDELLSQIRNEATREISLANAIQQYVNGLKRVDFAACPDEFMTAFQTHRQAWQASLDFFREHDELRGEMHELFEKIATLDKESASQLKSHLDAIMESWRAIESHASAGGAK